MRPPGRLGRAFLLAVAAAAVTTAPAAAAPTGAAMGQLDPAAAPLPQAGASAAELGSATPATASPQLAARLGAAAGRPGEPGLETVRRALSRVYRDPELSDLGHSSRGGNSLLSELASFLGHLAGSIRRAVAAAVWSAFALLVLVAGAGLSVVLLRRSRARLGLPEPSAAAQPRGPGPVRPERLFAQAEQLRSQGRFVESVRVSFQALLLCASERRVLEVDPSWTNSELLRAAARAGELEPALRPLVAQLDRAVYGGEDPGPDGASRFTARCRAAAAGLAR